MPSVTREQLEEGLSRYLPTDTIEPMAAVIVEWKVHLRISRERSSKFGDYRPPSEGKGHRISVNHNLNTYAFFITLVHELAHLLNWNEHRNRVDPHGKEWKSFFRKIMLPFQNRGIFPEDIELALLRYMNNPAASSCSDPHLFKVLSRYDDVPVIHLDDLPEGAVFRLPNSMTFVKGPRLRTRYRCKERKSGRTYLVNGIATVELVELPS